MCQYVDVSKDRIYKIKGVRVSLIYNKKKYWRDLYDWLQKVYEDVSSERPFFSNGVDEVGDVGESVDFGRLLLMPSFLMFRR